MGKNLAGKELGRGITQRKNGVYCGRYTDVYGRRISLYNKSLYALKDALERAKEKTKKAKSKISATEDLTLDEWFDVWLHTWKHGLIRPSTQVLYENCYNNHVSPALGKRRLSTLTQSIIRDMLNRMMDNGDGDATITYSKRILHDMLSKAEDDGRIEKNPCRGIRLKHNPMPERRILTREEQKEFFTVSSGTYYDNLFVVAVHTGLRTGELCALTWEDVDLDIGVIHVTKTLSYQKYPGDTGKEFHIGPPKTDAGVRDVPITASCAASLRKQYIQRAVVASKRSSKPKKGYENLLFVSRLGTPLNDSVLNDAISRLVLEINSMRADEDQFAPMSMHAFRHTFATRCLEAGIQPKVIQQYLGHASLQMTMDLYVHVTKEQSVREIRLLEKLDNEMDEDKEEKAEKAYSAYRKKEKEEENKVTEFRSMA